VTEGVAGRWRKVLGVTRVNNEGTHRLVQAVAEEGGAAAREWLQAQPEEVERRRQRFLGMNGPGRQLNLRQGQRLAVGRSSQWNEPGPGVSGRRRAPAHS